MITVSGRPADPARRSRAERYDAWFTSPWGRYAWAIETRAVLAALASRAGRKIADIGCGTGQLLAVLAAHGADAVGIDGYAVACIAVGLAVALPWLQAKGIAASPGSHGNLAVLGAVVISVALFAALGAGLGALLGGEIVTVTGLLLYLYVAEPLISHVTTLGQVTAYLPGVAADGLTQASQTGVRLLAPWQGGLVLAAWAAAIAAAGAVRTTRRDIT